ncbi:MAG: PQQ-binding-like beta-propeller repeat protein [Planctomycetaceae bacterium]
MNRFILGTICFNVALLSGLDTCAAGDWKQFRGSYSNSVAGSENLPVELSGSTIAWKAELPGRGLSGPIISGSEVFVSSSSGFFQDRLHMLCFDSASGEKKWHRQFTAIGRTMTHEKMANATPTMATDGKRLLAFFSSNDLICTDLRGRLIWFRGLGSEYPNASNSLGMSSSPIIVHDVAIVQVESDAEAFACGIDLATGETLWRLNRPRAANWTSPTAIVTRSVQSSLVLLQSSKGITAVRPADGSIAWNFEGGAATIPSTTVSDGVLYVPSNGVTALKVSAEGVEEIWNAANLSPSTASPVVYNGQCLVLNSSGVLSSGRVADGDRVWQLRLRGPFSSSPVVSGGHLYAFNESGTAFVVRLEQERGTIISELDLGEQVLCSPGVGDGALFVRSDQHLIRISRPE